MQWSERDLEDWAEHFMARYIHPRAKCIGRQITLPSGRRLDLLFHVDIGGAAEYVVVELKSVALSPADLAQLVGYMDEIQAGALNFGHVRGILVGSELPFEVESLAKRTSGVYAMQVSPFLDFECTYPVWEPGHVDGNGMWLDRTPEVALQSAFRAWDGTEDRQALTEAAEKVSDLLAAITPGFADDEDGEWP